MLIEHRIFRHPSGRPHHREKYSRLSIPRVPLREPLTPGLAKRREHYAETWGFVPPSSDDSDYEDRCR